MFRTALLLLAAFTINIFAQDKSQKSAAPEDPPWVKEVAAPRIVYVVAGMERIRARKDLTYKRVAGEELKMDVYAPPRLERGARRPAIIFIHGGRIPQNLLTKPKEWNVFVSFGQLAAASGFVGITFNHRFYAWESLGNSQSDVMDVIAYVREHAYELNVDKDRIVLWAVSAGGIFLSQPLRDNPSYIRCLVAYYAELDLQNERKSAPAYVTDEMLREYSPVYHLASSKRAPPIFIARAGLDNATLNDGLDRFIQTALSKNFTLEVMTHPTGHHAFDVLDDNDRSREIIARTIEFIKAHS